jgi:hypothetical protein
MSRSRSLLFIVIPSHPGLGHVTVQVTVQVGGQHFNCFHRSENNAAKARGTWGSARTVGKVSNEKA